MTETKPGTVDQRRLAYQIWELAGSPEPVDTVLAVGIAHVINSVAGDADDDYVSWTTVRTWLAEPETYTPYVDYVAVHRAGDFDWGAVASLSRHEREVLVGHLSEHPDPWGAGEYCEYGVSERFERLMDKGVDPGLRRALINEVVGVVLPEEGVLL